jgi:hypothetical protein
MQDDVTAARLQEALDPLIRRAITEFPRPKDVRDRLLQAWLAGEWTLARGTDSKGVAHRGIVVAGLPIYTIPPEIAQMLLDEGKDQ